MPDISWEHAAEARAALNAIVTDPEHGVAALSSAQTMSNLLKDLLPDAPREKSILVAAAEAGLADTLREHVSQGMDPSTAISLTASTFSTSTPFTPDACSWVAGELALALGISQGAPGAGGQQGMPTQVQPIPGFGAGAATQVAPQSFPQGPGQAQGGGFAAGPAGGQPGYSPTGQPGGYGTGQPGYSPSGQPGGYGTGPATGQPGYSPSGQPGGYGTGQPGYNPSAPGGQAGGYSPGGQAGGYSPGGQAGGYSPGGQAGGYGPGGTPVGYGPGPGFGPPGKSGTKRGLLIGGGIVAVIIVIIIIAASLSSKGTPSANGSTSPSPNPTTSSATPSPSPTTGVESLNTIMNPSGQAPVGTSCSQAPLAGLNGATLTSRTFCKKTSIDFTPTNQIVVWGYQFDSYSDYLAGFSKIKSVTGFKSAGAIHSCHNPTPTTSQFGSTTWQANHNPRYDKSHSQGQYLECFTEYTRSHVYQPLLIWTMPSQNVVFIGRDEASGATLDKLYHWWTYLNYS